MKILVVSDSHGEKQILSDLISRYTDEVDAFVHCGDSELSSQDLVWELMDSVRGNCDFDFGFQEVVVRAEAEVPYAIVHGHRHDVKWTLKNLEKLAHEEQLVAVFYGHSHVLKMDVIDHVLYLNPGSIQSPRGELREQTYCIVSFLESIIIVEVYNKKHQLLPNVSQTFERTVEGGAQ